MSVSTVRTQVASPPLFVGRARDLERLESLVARVRVTVVCGVAGIGKSTLAIVFAARRGKPVVRRRAENEPLATLVDDARRALAAGPVPELADDSARITDLAARLDRAEACWLLDDLHRLPEKARTFLVGELAQKLDRGTVIATSRERLLEPAGADHGELVLEGLDDSDAASLWRMLDELHGSATGAEVALRRAKGNPFQVRRAHAGGLHDDDPIASTVAALRPDELRLALALALAKPRIGVELLRELLPRDRAAAALRRLATLLVVDVDGASRCGLHDLFLEPLLAAASAEDRIELHVRLAELLQRDAELDPVVVVREVVRHLCAAGRYPEVARLVVARGADLVRRGATAELLRHLDTLPPGARNPATALARARCIARLLDLPRAHAEVGKLLEAGVEPRAGILMAHAELGFSLGDVAGGMAIFGEIMADERLDPELRASALDQLSLMRTHAGHGADARRVLREAEVAEPDGARAAAHAFARGLSAWIDDDDEALDLALYHAQGMAPHAGQPYAGRVLVPAAMAAMVGRLGRHDEAADYLAAAEAEDRHQDPYSQVYLHRMRGAVLYERGDRKGAAAELAHASRAYAASGAVLPAWSADLALARVQLLFGQRREALLVCERTRERAERAGALGVVRAVERSLALDPLTMWDGPDVEFQNEVRRRGFERAASCRALQARVAAVAALKAASRGDAPAARKALSELAATLRRQSEAASALRGYALNRALAHLAEATLARLDGRARVAEEERAMAARVAEEEGVDGDLISEIDRRLGHVRVITAEQRRTAPAPDLEAYSVVLDGARHQLRAPGKLVSFANRPALRRLLYALANHPNVVVSKEELARALWGASYKPTTHDGALWVNVRRLRVLLQRAGVAIDLREDGYALRVPPGFVFVDTSDERS